jgi:hypothetical protein
VKRQQKQLDAYEQRITDLETRLRWYRIALDLQADDSAPPREAEPFQTDPGLRDIEPRGELAAPPDGDLDREEGPLRARDDTASEQVPGPPESVQEDEKSPDHTRGSRIGRWLWRRLS